MKFNASQIGVFWWWFLVVYYNFDTEKAQEAFGKNYQGFKESLENVLNNPGAFSFWRYEDKFEITLSRKNGFLLISLKIDDDNFQDYLELLIASISGSQARTFCENPEVNPAYLPVDLTGFYNELGNPFELGTAIKLPGDNLIEIRI